MMTTFSCSYMFILLTESMTCIFLPSSPLRLRSFHFYISFSAFTTIVPAYLRLYFVPVLALQSSLYHLSHTVSHSCLYPIPAFQPHVSRATPSSSSAGGTLDPDNFHSHPHSVFILSSVPPFPFLTPPPQPSSRWLPKRPDIT